MGHDCERLHKSVKDLEPLLETLNNANNREKYATEFTFSVKLATLNKYIPLKGLLSP